METAADLTGINASFSGIVAVVSLVFAALSLLSLVCGVRVWAIVFSPSSPSCRDDSIAALLTS